MINSQKFNKTRTIEDKQTQREILSQLKQQNEKLSQILENSRTSSMKCVELCLKKKSCMF